MDSSDVTIFYFGGGNVDNGEDYACVGMGPDGKSLYILFNFGLNPKLR